MGLMTRSYFWPDLAEVIRPDPSNESGLWGNAGGLHCARTSILRYRAARYSPASPAVFQPWIPQIYRRKGKAQSLSSTIRQEYSLIDEIASPGSGCT
jgi:hypothetical protein